MTVNDLRVLIADLDGQMPVLVPGGDHEYFMAAVGVADVWRDGKRRPSYQESDVEGNTNEQALVVSAG